MTSQPQSEQDRVVIFDTTLRDGEQSPGATMTHEEKLEIAELLDEMGVDIIEAGFPIASEGDFLAVNEIAKCTKRAVVCGLSRAGQKDIDRCGEAIRPAERGRIHTFISTSPVHMKWKLQMEPEQVFQMVISSVTRARNYTDDVEWSAEDGTRTEHEHFRSHRGLVAPTLQIEIPRLNTSEPGQPVDKLGPIHRRDSLKSTRLCPARVQLAPGVIRTSLAPSSLAVSRRHCQGPLSPSGKWNAIGSGSGLSKRT